MPVPAKTQSAPAKTHRPGQLLADLEQRQDDVLTQLDELDSQLKEVLKGLGVSEESDDLGAS